MRKSSLLLIPVLFIICWYLLQVTILSLRVAAASLSPDIRESEQIGTKGGSIMAEDPVTGTSVGIYFPEGALAEQTTVTLVLHGSPLPKVIGKTHINGVTVLPEGLLLLEKVRIEVYNPSVEVMESTILYRIAGQQFIIPLGNQVAHVEENYIEGTFYITGRFSIGTPTPAEVAAQCRKLAAYHPSRPLACYGDETGKEISLITDYAHYEFPGRGGPSVVIAGDYPAVLSCTAAVDEECLRWQKALTKIEAIMTWIEFHQRNGNTSAENAEKRNAENTLQEAIDNYLNKASPSNRCGSYIKAAAKYLEAATLLGMNLGDESPIAQHFNQLVDECSFVFSVETREWINHPKEELDDGATFEEKSNWYGTLKCHISWNEFIATGTQKIRGSGNMHLHYEKHWEGDEKESHTITNASWTSEKIEGAVQVSDDGHGQLQGDAHVTIYWDQHTTTRIYGKRAGGEPYDESGSDNRSYKENKSFPLKNFEETIGNKTAGRSIKVFILKSPGDGRDNPDDCF